MGAPIVGPNGAVYVYVNVRRETGSPGLLHVIRPDGSSAWTYAMGASRQDFTHTATHLLGRAGRVYIAVGDALTSIDTASRGSWYTRLTTSANAPELALSDNGDLTVHTDDDRLMVFATESAGVAPSRWPAPGGGARNANARQAGAAR